MVIVTVGLADVSDPENIRSIRRSLRRQVPQRVWDRAILFHLRGGIDYSRLSLRHRVEYRPTEDCRALLPILEAVR